MSSFNHHFAPPTERVDTYPVVPARLIILWFMEKKKKKINPYWIDTGDGLFCWSTSCLKEDFF